MIIKRKRDKPNSIFRMKVLKYSISITITFIICCFILIEYCNSKIDSDSTGKTFSRLEKLPHNKVGLLLGCAHKLMNGQSNVYFLHRITAAVRLIENGKIDVIIVSGDNSRKGYDETTAMKEALLSEGIAEGKIFCDYAGFRTFDSVVRANAIFGCDEFTIISQEFHNNRALFIADKKGLDAIAYNAQDVIEFNSFKSIMRERLARVKTFLDIYLLNTQPRFYGPKVNINKSSFDL